MRVLISQGRHGPMGGSLDPGQARGAPASQRLASGLVRGACDTSGRSDWAGLCTWPSAAPAKPWRRCGLPLAAPAPPWLLRWLLFPPATPTAAIALFVVNAKNQSPRPCLSRRCVACVPGNSTILVAILVLTIGRMKVSAPCP